MNLDPTEKLTDEARETVECLEQLMGDVPKCINAPECTDGGVLT